MSDTNQIPDIRSDEALEDLLKHASPRPVPSPSDKDAVKRAVRAEWQDVAGRHQMRLRVFNYAIAATVLVGVFAMFSIFRAPTINTVQVATIQKSYGSVYVLGDQAELRETADLTNVMSGQTIATGPGAGLALAWDGGGSVRVDESTRVNFVSDEAIYLESGRIYFDSRSATLLAGINAGGAPRFVLHTDLGEVRHLGTQFMTRIADDALVVSVREGEVSIDGTYHKHVASPGEQVTFTGRERPSTLSIGHSGGAWEWVGRTTPAADVEGRTLHEFLVWVSRELGLELAFEGGAEQEAHDAVLKGTVNAELADALRIRLATADLHSRIDGGVIYISDNR